MNIALGAEWGKCAAWNIWSRPQGPLWRESCSVEKKRRKKKTANKKLEKKTTEAGFSIIQLICFANSILTPVASSAEELMKDNQGYDIMTPYCQIHGRLGLYSYDGYDYSPQLLSFQICLVFFLTQWQLYYYQATFLFIGLGAECIY